MEMYSHRPIRIITWGGLGDCVMLTPVIRSLKKKYPSSGINVYCSSPGHKDVFAGNPHITSIYDASFLGDPATYLAYRFGLVKAYYAKFVWDQLGYSLSGKHFVDQLAQEIFNISVDDIKPELYLSPSEEDCAREILERENRTIALHISSLSSQNHMWSIDKWNCLVARMPDYTFVQVGSNTEEPVRGAVNLLGRTTVRQAMAIIKGAVCFAGVESLFHHVSTAFSTPAVILLGDSDPTLFSYQGNRYLYKYVPCHPCESLLRRNKCPFGKECIESVTPDDVEKAIRETIKSRDRALVY